MNFVKTLSMFHVDAKEIPCLTGRGAPTEKTEGEVGVLYMNTDTGRLYSCTAADGEAEKYTWVGMAGADQTQGGSAELTPYIGENGNWYLGDTDTGVKAAGEDGDDGTSVTVAGVSESTEDGGSNVITFSDGKTITIRNGSKGSTGAAGEKGETGAAGAAGTAGKSAYQYAQDGGYTGTEAEFSEKLAKEYTLNPLYGKKVSFLGDSICAGADDDTSYLGGYGKIIADRNGMVYENAAHSGATVAAETYSRTTGNAKPWLCRMVDNMSADADYAIIEGGVNDGWDETVQNNIGSISDGYDAVLDDTTYYGAFESMLKQLVTKFQGRKIGYIAVPKIHSLFDSSRNVPNFYHIALECCAKWGVPVCDLNTITPPVEYLAELGTEYTVDACHPTYEGYLKYYCDPIEAWMKTLITSGGNQNASVSPEVISEINSKITALDTGKLSNAGVSFKKALLPLADGTTLEIDVLTAVDGTLVVKYVNRVPVSIAADGTIYGVDYDGDGTNDGYKKAYRLSGSTGVEKSVSNASVVGYIPAKAGDIVRFKYTGTSQCWDTYALNPGYNIMAYYNSSFTWLGSCCPLESSTSFYGICKQADNVVSGSVADGGIVSFTVPSNTDIAYLRLSIAMDTAGDMSLSNLIVTVNEEIT